MKRRIATLLVLMMMLATVSGCSTSCRGGTDRGMSCGTGTRF